MKFLAVAVCLAICGLALAHDHHDDHHGHPKYEFKYGVKDTKTGDIKDQWEHRDGDHVKGSYSLKEADGTTRVVDYHADGHSGFHADVKKIGHAHHPDTHHHASHADHHDHFAHHVADHHVHHGDHHDHFAHHVADHHAHHVDHHDHHGHASSYIEVHHH